MNFSFWPFLWFGLPGRLLNFKEAVLRLLRPQRHTQLSLALLKPLEWSPLSPMTRALCATPWTDFLKLEEPPPIANFRRLFVTCDVFTRGFFLAFCGFFRGFFCGFFCGPHLLEKNSVWTFFVAFLWPSFWANLTRTRPGKVF